MRAACYATRHGVFLSNTSILPPHAGDLKSPAWGQKGAKKAPHNAELATAKIPTDWRGEGGKKRYSIAPLGNGACSHGMGL